MRFTSLIALCLALSAKAQVNTSQYGEDDRSVPVTDPRCLDNNETSVCIPTHEVCTEKPDTCCDGLACLGYAFYKKCVVPTCRREWYDCEANDQCCNDLVCATVDNGGGRKQCEPPCLDCPKDTPIPDPPQPPSTTSAPTRAPVIKNPNTTTPEDPVRYHVACATGDPHLTTFDGLPYDCQVEGEMILARSSFTARQVRVRNAGILENRAFTSIHGVVIEDEGVDTPKLQFSVPTLKNALANTFLTSHEHECKIQAFINEKPIDLNHALPDEYAQHVSVVRTRGSIEVLFTRTKFKVRMTLGYWNGCLMNTCVYWPTVDPVVGLLGTPNHDVSDDWVKPDGTVVPLPPNQKKYRGKYAYDYCANWCVRHEKDSAFFHNEIGVDFDDFQRCNVPFGTTDHKLLEKVTPEIQNYCKDDVSCMIDAITGGLNAAKETRAANIALRDTCNGAGGECLNANCCGGLHCHDLGRAGKFCHKEATLQCLPEEAPCSGANVNCCNGLTCTQLANGKSECLSPNHCFDEGDPCTADSECCGDKNKCVPSIKGGKHCRVLPQVSIPL